MKSHLFVVKSGESFFETLFVVRAKTIEEAKETVAKHLKGSAVITEHDEVLDLRKKIVYERYIGE